MELGLYHEIGTFLKAVLQNKKGVGHTLVKVHITHIRGGGSAEGEQGAHNVVAA